MCSEGRQLALKSSIKLLLPGKDSGGTDSTNRNRYKLGKLLGKGAYGTVINAMDTFTIPQAEVAIKFIPTGQKELAIFQKLKHENIVQFKSFYTFNEKGKGETLAIVMEYCSNGNLKDKLCVERFLKNEIDVSLRYHWYIQLASAVEYMHLNGIIHRDLKPENILIADDHKLKIADVGIAKNVSECSDLTFDTPNHAHFAKTCIGTKSYMAPEIYAGKRYGMPCDVFSLGLVFWMIAELPESGPQFKYLGETGAIGLYLSRCYTPLNKPTDLLFPRSKISSEFEQAAFNAMLQRIPDYRPSISVIKQQLEAHKLSVCRAWFPVNLV